MSRKRLDLYNKIEWIWGSDSLVLPKDEVPMNWILCLAMSLLSLTAFAKPQLKPTELHLFNSKIAKLLDFNNPESYKKISKNLSYKDKQVFQKLFTKKKAQKVKLLPFMSFLYIKDAQTQISIQIVDLKPLKLKVDGRVVRTIDLKNIRGSFPNGKQNKVSFWESWLLPKAHAWCLINCEDTAASNTANDWELLYAYAASSEIHGGWQPIVSDTDSALVARESAEFVNEFGISRINCKPSHLTNFNNETRNYIEIVGQGGHRSALECDALQNNCKIAALDARGQFRNLPAEKSKLDHELVQSVSELALQEAGLQTRINPNALDVRCDEDSCRLVSSGSEQHPVSSETLAKLSNIDLSSLGDRSTRARTKELVTQLNELQRLNDLHTPPEGRFYPPENRGKAMYTMMACCGSPECVSYVNGQGKVEIQSKPTSVGQ